MACHPNQLAELPKGFWREALDQQYPAGENERLNGGQVGVLSDKQYNLVGIHSGNAAWANIHKSNTSRRQS
jgi:hypothetical protein